MNNITFKKRKHYNWQPETGVNWNVYVNNKRTNICIFTNNADIINAQFIVIYMTDNRKNKKDRRLLFENSYPKNFTLSLREAKEAVVEYINFHE